MLNYTVPPLQFLIGAFDASQYLDSISLSVPMHEPGQPLLWSGQFKISKNLKAKANGLTDSDFSEYGNPGRWRPYQQQVRLNIRGYQSPVFRIENYRYNAQTRSGEGMLTQIPTAVAGDRPGDLFPTTVGGSIGGAINALLAAAFKGATVTPARSGFNDGGVLDVPLVTRDPWADACRLSGLGWNWITVSDAESIVSINGTGGSMLFSRSLVEVELAPDLAAIYQSASKIIVTGARQIEDKSTPGAIPTVPRPKFKKTTELRPIGTVFSSLDGDATPMTFEEKTIIYQYWDDDSWSGYLPFGTFLTSFLYDIQSVTESGIDVYGKPPIDLNVPMQTITIKRQPLGFLLPSLGVNTTLTDGEVIIESNLRKLVIKPRGVLFSSAGTDATLIIEKRENLTTELIPPGTQLGRVAVNADGTAQKFETKPKPEPLRPIAERPLKTEVLKGTARTSPIGWTPIFDKPLVIDFGFLPDAGRANFLAGKIAAREQWRRDQDLVDMPIPNEWLASGWEPLSKCQIGDSLYLMDGCALSIADGVAKFGFTGAKIGRYPMVNGVPTGALIPVFNILCDLDLGLVSEIEVFSTLVISAPILLVSSSISLGLVTEIELNTTIAIVSAIDVGVIPEIGVTASIATVSTLIISLISEIDVTSLVTGGSATISIEGSGGVIEGYDGTIFTVEGKN